jgi:threonine dehydrogenase-like Zn-dependent dehydrogenase
MAQTMVGAVLPGNSTVELREYPVPQPGSGQVLLKMKASTICGSDIRAIYREHLGKGPEGYRGVICGHEPSGQIVATGPDMRRFKEGDRVLLAADGVTSAAPATRSAVRVHSARPTAGSATAATPSTAWPKRPIAS